MEKFIDKLKKQRAALIQKTLLIAGVVAGTIILAAIVNVQEGKKEERRALEASQNSEYPTTY